MRVLIIGGTGLISGGIVKHLLGRKADITLFNRGKRDNPWAGQVKVVVGDRNEAGALEKAFAGQTFDAVIDMICFSAEQAEADVRAFAGRCGHFLFCSTVCTYGTKVPRGVVVDETFAQEPISDYGRNKLAAERVFLGAQAGGKLNATIVRPSNTYGPGHSLIDNLEGDPPTWDRMIKGLPVLCAGDGLGLWVSTHRDDCGKFFAYAAGNSKTFGQAYNATREVNFTWSEYYRQAAEALGVTAKVLYLPAAWIVKQDPKRFGLLREITAFHGAYTSAKAMRDVPEYRCEKIDFVAGAKQTLEDVKRRGAWKSAEGDRVYESLVELASQ
jgi:nucleoside-diphosphate-sugar epimerase